MKTCEKLEKLLSEILQNITIHSQEVTVSVASMATLTLQADVICNENDVGRVLGKGGTTIRSIRTVAHCAAAIEGYRNVYVDIT